MRAAHEDVAVEAVGCRLLPQGVGADEEPGKRFTLDGLVLQLVGQFAIVTLNTSKVYDTVLVLIEVAQVAGIT